MFWRATNWKATLLTGALGGFLLLGGSVLPGGTAQARDRDCLERIRGEETKLQRDIDRHGLFSRQAEHRRAKIRELREGCRVERFRNRRWNNDGDHDRDDRRWGGRQWHRRGDGDHDRDDRWRRHGDGDHDRDDRWHRDD